MAAIVALGVTGTVTGGAASPIAADPAHEAMPKIVSGRALTVPARMPHAKIKAAPILTFREIMIPMRDGIRLQTVILAPVDQREPLPILLDRGPYGVPNRAMISRITKKPRGRLKELFADGYIFVFQNLRGRFKSEGTFTLSADNALGADGITIETRDAYDTVDWLVKHVSRNNGRVGMYGVSYDGYATAAALLKPHPALKAISEQASPVDWWMNDDMHRFGALRLSYAFEYSVLEETAKGANTNFNFDGWDTYEWYLNAGALPTLNAKYLHGKIPYWNEIVQHPNYDAFWRSQAWVSAVHRSTVPNLNVAGFWDQEDPWGPWQIFRHAAASDPGHTNLMVAGPWFHGQWYNEASTMIGPASLGQDTAKAFRANIQAPFFAYWLHGKGTKPAWQATTFQTGSNRWKTYTAWPPANAKPTNLYLHSDGTLSFLAPRTAQNARRTYVSDPANPVPYRQRPISPTYPGGDWPTWESADQRFVDHRPDVLTYVSAPLPASVIVSGQVAAEIYASTSGTDGDLVVKLIDVFPENAQKAAWPAERGPLPGDYAKSANGYELPIAMEIRRGRFLTDNAHPTALTPNKPVRWTVPLRDRDHVFLKGHRIMVQLQSTWFPVIDRNPQRFVPSIYKAAPSDFVSATYRVFSTPSRASRIVLPVVVEAQH